MRLRILELPMQHLGETSTTPFAIVIDRFGPNREDEMVDSIRTAIGAAIGAQAVLVFDDEIELA